MPIENRGFASLSPERRREIARLGGLRSRGGGRPRKIKEQDQPKANNHRRPDDEEVE